MEYQSGSGVETSSLDAPLALLGFKYDEITPEMVSGHLPVTDKCCQVLKVMHGGVSALIAESLASMGAHLANGLNRVAGVHLAINHLNTAVLGDLVFAHATPHSIAPTIQVWDVRLSKINPSKPENKTVISSSRVTLVCNMPVPDNAKDAGDNLRQYAKL